MKIYGAYCSSAPTKKANCDGKPSINLNVISRSDLVKRRPFSCTTEANSSMGCPGFNVSVLNVASSATREGLFVILQNSFLNSVSRVNHVDLID